VRQSLWWTLGAALALSAPGGGEPLLLKDFQALASPASLGRLALALGAAGAAHNWDDELSGRIDNPAVEPLLDLGNFYASTSHSLAGTAALWLAARASGFGQAEAVAAEMARALILANAVVGLLKVSVRRERPDGSDRYSFPSGHAANAFALATALGGRHGLRVRLPLYAFSTLVPIARVHGRRHFFADVVGGGLIGIVAGQAVHQQEEPRMAWQARRAGEGWLLQVGWRL
jgi:membrane-associated phospholipid phosphatase